MDTASFGGEEVPSVWGSRDRWGGRVSGGGGGGGGGRGGVA